jgi:hypothetical protein
MNVLLAVNWSTPQTWLLSAGIACALGTLYALFLLYSQRKPTNTEPEDPDLLKKAADVWLPAGEEVAGRRMSVRRQGAVVEVAITDRRCVARPRLGYVLDRSTGGLRIATDVIRPVNSLMNVRAKSAPDYVPWTMVEVRSCRQVGDYYEVGCMFVEPPPWSVLLLFG